MKLDCSFHVFLFTNRRVTEMFVCRSVAQAFAWRCWISLHFLCLAGSGDPNITLHLSERSPLHIPGLGICNFPAAPIRLGKISCVFSCVQRRKMNLVKDLDHKSDEEWLRKLEVLCLEKGRVREEFIALYNYLEGGCSEVGSISQVTSDRTRLNDLKFH